MCDQAIAAQGMWADGHLLVVEANNKPNTHCPISNENCTDEIHHLSLKQSSAWVAPLVLLNILAYILVKALTDQQLKINLRFNTANSRKYKLGLRSILVLDLLMLLCIIGPGGYILFMMYQAVNGPEKAFLDQFAIVIYFLLGLIGLILLLSFVRKILELTMSPLKRKKIVDQYVWLAGAHEDFLRNLPAYDFKVIEMNHAKV